VAVHLDYDTDKRIIYVTTAPTAGELILDVRKDIYSDMKEDWRTDATLNKMKFPLFQPVGGNQITGTKKISSYYFLKYEWRCRPYEEDHTLYLENGYLLVEGGGNPWIKTMGGYTVNIRDSIPADAFDTGSSSVSDILKLTGYKVTKSGDVITIYEADGVTPWRQYNLSGGGRVQV